ncbi:MAG: DUF4231 domain-containing protein [Lachnospiraceae bacterium]|nr:DUF4231 domain-containing protein [Lachnospiraceae bacterium]
MNRWKEFGVSDNPLENLEERLLIKLLAKDMPDADRSEIFRGKYKRFRIGGAVSLVLGALLTILSLVMNKPMNQIGRGVPFIIYALIALVAYLEVIAWAFEWVRPIANFSTALSKVGGLLFAKLTGGEWILDAMVLFVKLLFHCLVLCALAMLTWRVFPLPFIAGFLFYRKMMAG